MVLGFVGFGVLRFRVGFLGLFVVIEASASSFRVDSAVLVSFPKAPCIFIVDT